MAGSGAARSAGVAYIDLAVGDTKRLVDGITEIVRQAANQAQAELARGFDVSGSAGSFGAVAEAATHAAGEAGSAISRALTESAGESAGVLGESITSAVTNAATSAAGHLESIMGEAGRAAGEQLAFNFEAAAQHMQLSLFEPAALATQAATAGRAAGTGLTEGVSEGTASLGSVLSGIHFASIRENIQGVTDAIGGGLRFAGTGLNALASDVFRGAAESGRASLGELGKTFDEFKQGISYSVGSWGIGYMIGNSITMGVSEAFSALKEAVFGFNSDMQSAAISFRTLLGSEEESAQMIGDIKEFALKTPFQFENTVQYSQRLLALGIDAKNIIPDLTALGDAVSALGGDPATLNGVVTAFGEMQSIGNLSMVHIRQLEIRGIPALKILAAEYGVSTLEMKKMVSTGELMSDEALPKLIDGLEHGTKATKSYGGEMAEQSLTFKGAVSNIKDGLTQLTASAGKPVFDVFNHAAVKTADKLMSPEMPNLTASVAGHVGSAVTETIDFASKLFEYLSPLQNVAKDLFDIFSKYSILLTIAKAVGPAVLVVAQAIGAIANNKVAAQVIADIIYGFILWKGALEAFNIVMAITDAVMDANPITLLVVGVAALVIGFVALYQHSSLFRSIIQSIGDFFVTVWHGVLIAFNFVKDGLVAGFDIVWGWIKSVLDSGPVHGFATGAGTALRTFKDVVMESIHAVATVFVWLWKNILEPVVDGIWFALRLLAVIIFTLIVTPFVIAYHILEPVLDALWRNVIKPVFDGIGKGATWLWKNVLVPVFDGIGDLFSGRIVDVSIWLWKNAIEPVFHGIGTGALWLWHNILVPFGEGTADVVRFIGDVATWLWKNVLSPVFSGIGDVFTWLYQWVIRPWFDGIVATFQGIADVASWLWRNILSPIFSGIGTAASWMWENVVKPVFNYFVEGFKEIGRWASWLYDNAIKPVFDVIGRVIDSCLSGIKSGFKTAVDGISSIWSGLVDVLKTPVNFLVNTVYTHGIREVWNFIADKVGIPELPEAPHFAEGGVVGGPRSAGDWIPVYATAGEGILTTDEMEALGGPAGFNALRAALGNTGFQSDDNHYKSGGIISSVLGGLKSAGGAVMDGIGSLESYASRVVRGGLQSVAKDMLKPVLNGLGSILPGESVLKHLLVGIPNTLIDKVLGWLGGQDKKATASAVAGMPSELYGWIQSAESLAGVTSDWTAGLAQLIRFESGGNPRAINLTDSNAAMGDPSRGLMQTIMSTFQAYRLKSLPDDIYDPVANIVAGIRYILARYGSINNVPGFRSIAHGGSYVGYATGTDNATPGLHWVGENGPELVDLRGGERVFSNRDSMDIASRISVPSAPAISRNAGSPFAAAPVEPKVFVTVLVDGEELINKRIDVKIDSNNDRLAAMLGRRN